MPKTSLSFIAALVLAHTAFAVGAERVVDIPTRPGVTQRFLLNVPPDAKVAAILFAGGHGGLQITDAGALRFGRNNFLVRAAPLYRPGRRGGYSGCALGPPERALPGILPGNTGACG